MAYSIVLALGGGLRLEVTLIFDPDQFVADCRAAIGQDPSHKFVGEVVAHTVSDPAAVLKGLGEPKRAAIQPLYRSNDLTILNVIWPSSFTLIPHNHQMWAVNGVYTGREDNIFWRRLPESTNGTVEAVGLGHYARKTPIR